MSTVLAAASLAVAVWLWIGDRSGAKIRPSTTRAPRRPWCRGRAGVLPVAARLRASALVTGAALVVGWGWFDWWTPAVAVAAGALGFIFLGLLEPVAVKAEREAAVLALPEVLDLLASVLAAGAPLRVAARQVAQVCDPAAARTLDLVAAQVSVGVGDAAAWRSVADDPAWGDAARDLARSAESGTAVVDVLLVHARDARRRRREMLQSRARTVGVRSVLPLVCCYLPAFILIGVIPILDSVLSGVLAGQ